MDDKKLASFGVALDEERCTVEGRRIGSGLNDQCNFFLAGPAHREKQTFCEGHPSDRYVHQ
jgi:hypothetical protein